MKNRKAPAVIFLILILFTIVSCKTGTIVYGDPASSDVAVIFYPGGKVDPYAYEDLCRSLAEEGIPVIVAEMSMDLAIFGINRANGIISDYPDVDNWFLCGHSLGGAMAAVWCAKHQDDVQGLIFLAAYSTKELELPVLSIYGSNDGVLKMNNYSKNLKNLSDVEEHIIEGGNHCQFGSYGFQKGDNEATVSHEQQIEKTVALIVEFIRGTD